MNTLEQVISTINANIFLSEFSFSRNQFRPSPDRELEFADQVVAFANVLMLFQVKEKTGSGNGDRWFTKKVLGLATKQIRDTLGYLRDHRSVTLTNNRGHVFTIHESELTSRVKLVLYSAASLSPLMINTRHHVSRTAGMIHILNAYDYDRLCRVLVTPAEILEYFEFREQLLARHTALLPGEKALVGQFLAGHLDATPSSDYTEVVDQFRDSRHDWDISHITQRFGDRITHQLTGHDNQPGSETLYYKVLSELALLIRPELAAFRLRFDMCVSAARKREFQIPLRMITRSGCGFLFLAITPDKAEGRLRGLENLTSGSKYEQRLERHVGVVICPEGDDLLIDWIYIESPWQPDPVLDEKLQSSNPFLPLRKELSQRYRFDA